MTDYQHNLSPWYGLDQDIKHMKSRLLVLEQQIKLLEECKHVFLASNTSTVSDGGHYDRS